MQQQRCTIRNKEITIPNEQEGNVAKVVGKKKKE